VNLSVDSAHQLRIHSPSAVDLRRTTGVGFELPVLGDSVTDSEDMQDPSRSKNSEMVELEGIAEAANGGTAVPIVERH
jgi:hypothetical protein